ETDGTNGAFDIVANLNGNDDGFPLIQTENLPILNGDLYLNAREATPTDRELYRLTGVPPNTAPTATNTTQTVSYTEDDASAAITNIVVTDPDAGEQITATITLANTATGAFTANDGATYTAGTGVWTISGTVAEVNTALAGVAFTPAANNGTDTTASVNIADGGEDGAAAVTGTITLDVTPVNDEPDVTLGANQTVNEDAGAQTVAGFATTSTGGGTDEAGQTVDLAVSNTNAGLFVADPAIDGTGQLTYTPAANANGTSTVTVTASDDGGTANGGDDTGPDRTFTITVTAVNDEPSFTTSPAGDDQTVLEDAGAQTVATFAAASPGPANESGQTISYGLSNDNNGLFTAQPAISASGELTYTPAADAAGTATVSVVLSDDGGTANGGDDTAPTVTFDITITPINDEPDVTLGPDETVNEDPGTQTVAGFAVTSTGGGADEAGQTVTLAVSNTNNGLFSSQPAITAGGTLTYTPAANANGSATVTVTASDDGGTANGGDDTGPDRTFTITVNAVNDEPIFVIDPQDDDQTVDENAGAQSVADFASAAPGGGADEAGQTVTLTVTNDTNALFAVQPSIDGAGTLTYTPAADVNGTATVTVTLTDDGGTANGGDDTADATFTITVTAINSPPTLTLGADPAVDEDAGPQAVPGFVTTTPGPGADEAGQTVTVTVASTNPALFDVAPAVDGSGELTYTPAADANGTSTVTITATDDGAPPAQTQATATITVSAVNDEPVVQVPPADQTILEDAGAQTVAPAIQADPGGGDDEDGQTLTYDVSTDDDDLFAVAPAIDSTGALTFTPVADVNGQATVTVTLSDDGGTANGGDDTADAVTFLITVTPVNDAPVLTVGDDQGVAIDAGAQTVADHSTATPGGGADEAAQVVTFGVTTDNDGLFDVLPSIDGGGTLTFTSAGVAGSATVTVVATDDGGTANGGDDTSPVQTFTITVAAPADVSIDDVTVAEGAENETTPAVFTISLSEAQATPVTVQVTTSDGTADVDADYEPLDQTAEIPAGETATAVEVTVIGDDVVEDDETFTVTLSDATGAAVITDGEGLGTITNDDERGAPIPGPPGDNSDTSVLSSQLSFPDGLTPDSATDTANVLLANDDIFADSLASGVLQPDAPLLLTDRSGLEDEVAAEMERLGATNVRILGGTAAVPMAIEDELIDLGYEVDRTFGPTRVETAIAIAELFPTADTAILARAYGLPDGSNPSTAFADSLAAGALASDFEYPILLTETERLTATTRAYLEQSSITTLLVVGGPAAVADSVLEELTELGITVQRWAGDDRSATAVAIASARGFVDSNRPDSVVLLEGWDEDAWAAGFTLAGYADRNNAPVVLANGQDLPDPSTEFLGEVQAVTDPAPPVVCAADETACAAAETILEP
ncbi:tandem-95 repeat protein, partial [Euzebya tangerina]|uniref:tandem-95 repeat protein n=1 Tax=Euzebya tangerina TaxID=591198 RepID=UPI002F3116B6